MKDFDNYLTGSNPNPIYKCFHSFFCEFQKNMAIGLRKAMKMVQILAKMKPFQIIQMRNAAKSQKLRPERIN